jgi:hypothetical protein
MVVFSPGVMKSSESAGRLCDVAPDPRATRILKSRLEHQLKDSRTVPDR